MGFINIESFLDRLATLVNIDSGSYDPEGINRVADVIESWYKDLGWYVKAHDLGPETGRMLEISNHPDCDHYDVVFTGHMDTVFPKGTVAERPFTRNETTAFGPGVSDMKNGDVAMYETAAHLSKEALDKLNICMLYNPDEEIGSIYSAEGMDSIAAKADVIYVMESAGAHGVHCFARKGRMEYVLRFHGKAGHAGFMFDLDVASAVLEMGHCIVDLMNLASREANTTVNVGVAKGGIATNVVADTAELWVESRFTSDSERERIRAAVEEMIAHPHIPGVSIEVIKHTTAKNWSRTGKGEAHRLFMQGVAEKLGLEFGDKDRGGLSDANHMSKNCDVIADGMGPSGGRDHSPDEFLTLSSIDPCVQLCCGILEEMAAAK